MCSVGISLITIQTKQLLQQLKVEEPELDLQLHPHLQQLLEQLAREFAGRIAAQPSFPDQPNAAIHIEDQISPKRCGHVAGKQVIPLEEAAGKIRAACDARRDPDFVIIARTDAVAAVG